VLVTDTDHHTGEDHFPSYEEIYRIFNSANFPMDDENLGVYQNILRRDIHLVVTRPSLFTYNKATQWCFKQFDMTTMTIMTKQGKRVASLRPKYISSRYHLPTPTCSLNELLLKGFPQVSKAPAKQMKHWWADEEKTLKQGQKIVPTHRLKTPYKMLVDILCRLYGEEKSTHFQTDWMPLAHIVIKTGKIFNWEDIVSFNICLHMNNLPGMKKPCFHTSAYMIDAI
jgi:hypothetical protein